MTTLYGISNCDSVRKARIWLSSHDVDYQFHDFRQDGLSLKQLKTLANAVGWETLLNRRSQTWRKLADKDKTNLTEASALKLMQAEPTLIKRPVLEVNKRVHVGFTAADYQQLFS
jgi:arsenate reductase